MSRSSFLADYNRGEYMQGQLLVLAYRNADGHLRVSPSEDTVFTNRKVAVAAARYWAGIIGYTVRVLDFAPEVNAKGALADYDESHSWDDGLNLCESHDAANCSLCGTYM